MMKAYNEFIGEFDGELRAETKRTIKEIRGWFLEQYPDVKAYYNSIEEKSKKSA
jgi:hypothetical protein